MPCYRIHRLRDHLRPSFRSAPHSCGAANIKPRDYEPAGSVEAPSPYAAFFTARDSGAPIEIGDVLEAPDGSLRICKFVGFEEARWVVPEPKADPPANETAPAGAAALE